MRFYLAQSIRRRVVVDPVQEEVDLIRIIGLGLGLGTGLGLGSDHSIPRFDVRAPLGPARDRTEDRTAGDGEACRHEAQ